MDTLIIPNSLSVNILQILDEVFCTHVPLWFNNEKTVYGVERCEIHTFVNRCIYLHRYLVIYLQFIRLSIVFSMIFWYWCFESKKAKYFGSIKCFLLLNQEEFWVASSNSPMEITLVYRAYGRTIKMFAVPLSYAFKVDNSLHMG